MHRQKIRLLRRLSESEVLGFLPGDALKLYLVLLVSAERIGREETICVQILRRGLGRHLTRRQLQRIGMALQRRGLATLEPVSRARQAAGRDETLRFRLLAPGGRGAHGGRKPPAPRAGRGR